MACLAMAWLINLVGLVGINGFKPPSIKNYKKLALLLTLIAPKGLYPATEKNTAMESLWVGRGIDFICTPFQVGQARGFQLCDWA